jgi:hypothetical protein
MPTQEGVGLHQEDRPAVTVEHTCECREDRPVVEFKMRTRDLALQDRELVAQDKNLGILGPVSAPTQHQQVEDESKEAVQASHALILIEGRRTDQVETRNPRSRCPDEFSAPTCSATRFDLEPRMNARSRSVVFATDDRSGTLTFSGSSTSAISKRPKGATGARWSARSFHPSTRWVRLLLRPAGPLRSSRATEPEVAVPVCAAVHVQFCVVFLAVGNDHCAVVIGH